MHYQLIFFDQDEWISTKIEGRKYPAVLTEEAWSIKDLLYGLIESFFLCSCGTDVGQGVSILLAYVVIRTQDWHARRLNYLINKGQCYQPIFLSAQGEIEFYILLTKELPDEVKDGVARFEGLDDVNVDKLNSFTLRGTVPRKYQ